MDNCVKCCQPTHTYISGVGFLCKECRELLKQEQVLEKSKTLQKASDFKQWDSGDMSELFWIHLGKYVKTPNRESLYFMELAYRWACHDNHGISNSFYNAMKWAGINLWEEERKWAEEK